MNIATILCDGCGERFAPRVAISALAHGPCRQRLYVIGSVRRKRQK